MASTVSPADETVLAIFETSKKEFFRYLKDQSFRAEIEKTTSIDNVYEETKRLQEDQGKRRSLRNLRRIDIYLQRLNQYGGVFDTFVQAKPDILALIWGPIKLLIHISSNLVKSFDAILDTMCMIGGKLPIFKDYAKLLAANPRVNHVLALIFRDILDFHLAALNFFAIKGWRVAFEALWPTRRDEINLTAQNIEKHSRLLVEEVTLDHISRAHDEWTATRKHYKEQREERDNQAYNSIEQYIQPYFYDKRLDQLHNSICEGTGSWLTKDAAFCQWLDPANTSADVIWLQGFPGAGKTYMASRVVDYAKEKGHTLFAFLRYIEEATALSLLHSFIFQLVTLNKDLRAALCSELGSTTRDLKRDLKGSTSFAAKTFVKLLKCATSPVYMVVDRLDEVEEYPRRLILDQLLDLRNKLSGDAKIKLFISSRREDNIEKLLRGVGKIIRLDQNNASCIQKYIAWQSQAWMIREAFDPQTYSEIKSLLAFLPVDVEGMFLYARIVMSVIQRLPPQIELIREELKVPPRNLHEAYQRVLQRIEEMPDSVKKISKRILAYIACTSVSITVREMDFLVLLDPGEIDELPRVRSSVNITQYCGPLVDIVDDNLQFAHFTVKEYLSDRNVTFGFINLCNALSELAEVCLRYLLTDSFSEDLSDEDFERGLLSGLYRLWGFASSQWYHLALQALSSQRRDPGDFPDRLISVLEEFISLRENASYEPLADLQELVAREEVTKASPHIHNFLRRMGDFIKRQRDAAGWRLLETEKWLDADPTTLSSTSAYLYQALERLLDSRPSPSSRDSALQLHYGPRLYKCDYLVCPHSRLGFAARSDRDAHIRRHNRPFKCPQRDCDFSVIGFLTQRQQDDHWNSLHAPSTPGKPQTPSNVPKDDDEFMAFVARLVNQDSVDEVKPLVKRIGAHWAFRRELLLRVAFSGSVNMLQLLANNDQHFWRAWISEITTRAIQGENESTLRFILGALNGKNKRGRLLGGVRQLSRPVFASDSAMAFEVWASEYPTVLGLSGMDFRRASPTLVPRIAAFLMKHPCFQNSTTEDLNSSLQEVAQVSCSVLLARLLIEAGAQVNKPLSGRVDSKTPLHHAAKKTTQEAAELIQYLLLAGADPNLGSVPTYGKNKSQKVLPGSERGARNIRKWLGMTWDELVKWAQEERARMAAVARTESPVPPSRALPGASSTPSRAAGVMSFSNILSSSEPVSKPRPTSPLPD